MSEYNKFFNVLKQTVTTNFDSWVNQGLIIEIHKFDVQDLTEKLNLYAKSQLKITSRYMFTADQSLFLAAKYVLYTANCLFQEMEDFIPDDIYYNVIEDLFASVVRKVYPKKPDIETAIFSAEESLDVDDQIRFILVSMNNQNHQYN